jgi:hypothetical protein
MPIRRSAFPREANCAKQSQLSRRVRKWARTGRAGNELFGVNRAKQSQFLDCGLRILQNEANLERGSGFRDQGSATWHPTPDPCPLAFVRNEPNSTARPGPRRAKCAKRTQFAPPWARRRGVKDAKRSQFAPGVRKWARTGRTGAPAGTDYAKRTQSAPGGPGKTIAKPKGLDAATRQGGQPRETKPIVPGCPEMGAGRQTRAPAGVHCAKQSQFRAVPGGTRLGGRGPWRAIMQNKANLAPLSGNGRAERAGPWQGRIVRNKANLPMGRRRRSGATCPKTNFHSRSDPHGRASGFSVSGGPAVEYTSLRHRNGGQSPPQGLV